MANRVLISRAADVPQFVFLFFLFFSHHTSFFQWSVFENESNLFRYDIDICLNAGTHTEISVGVLLGRAITYVQGGCCKKRAGV